MTKTMEYNLKETIILHDKYEEIEKEMGMNNINVSTNVEYTKLIIDNNIILSMKVIDGKIFYNWKVSYSDKIIEIIAQLAIIAFINSSFISNILMKRLIIVTIGHDMSTIIIDILLLVIIIAFLALMPSARNRRKKKLDHIISELSAKNIIS